MDIKVLGPGCAKCKTLDTRVREVVAKNSIDAQVEKITEIPEIMKYGILMTPGLVINGKVKSSGSVPNEKDILKWMEEEQK